MRFGWRARDLFGLIRRVEARSLRKGVARHHGVSLHGERSFEEQVKAAIVAPLMCQWRFFARAQSANTSAAR
jgi:hypothetical protein